MSSAKTSGKLGYAHYVRLPDDGRRHEIVGGDHYVNPAPGTYHQTVSKRLQYQLYTQVELKGLGLVFNAPIDVQLTEHDIVQPDLAVLLNSKKSIITPTKIKGTPDWIIEILSPGSVQHDRTLKWELYQRVGVPEYWIVDPDEHAVEQFVLREGVYQLQPAGDGSRCSTFDAVTIRWQDVW